MKQTESVESKIMSVCDGILGTLQQTPNISPQECAKTKVKRHGIDIF